MKDIILKRNQLCNKSLKLRTAKFNQHLKREQVTKLIEEQDKIYNQYIFYKQYLKAYEKEKKK